MKVCVVTDERYPDYWLGKEQDSVYPSIEMTEDEFSQWEKALSEYEKWSKIIEDRLEQEIKKSPN